MAGKGRGNKKIIVIPGQGWESSSETMDNKGNINIAVAGTGYVGLSIATLLSQHHHVTAVDVIPEKVELINRRKSPIQDECIEKYLAEKDLDLVATLDGASAARQGPGTSSSRLNSFGRARPCTTTCTRAVSSSDAQKETGVWTVLRTSSPPS